MSERRGKIIYGSVELFAKVDVRDGRRKFRRTNVAIVTMTEGEMGYWIGDGSDFLVKGRSEGKMGDDLLAAGNKVVIPGEGLGEVGKRKSVAAEDFLGGVIVEALLWMYNPESKRIRYLKSIKEKLIEGKKISAYKNGND